MATLQQLTPESQYSDLIQQTCPSWLSRSDTRLLLAASLRLLLHRLARNIRVSEFDLRRLLPLADEGDGTEQSPRERRQ